MVKPSLPVRGAGRRPVIGDTVLLRLDTGVMRPLLVSAAQLVTVGPSSAERQDFRVSGLIACEPDDHTTAAFRTLGSTADPARIHGRPERTLPVAYGEYLREGSGIGEWTLRPTNLPAGEGR